MSHQENPDEMLDTEPEVLEPADADLRDLSAHSREQRCPYTLEFGFRARRETFELEPWIHADEQGMLQVDCNELQEKMPKDHVFCLDYSRTNYIPLPTEGLLAQMLIDPDVSKNNIDWMAQHPFMPGLVLRTPPLWCLLNSVRFGDKHPEKTARLSPWVTSAGLMLRYMNLLRMLAGDKNIPESKRLRMDEVFNGGVTKVDEEIDALAFPPMLIEAGKRWHAEMGTADNLVAKEQDQEPLMEAAKLLASSTLALIRLAESSIIFLLDENLDYTKFHKDLQCEAQAVMFGDIDPKWSQDLMPQVAKEWWMVLPLRLRYTEQVFKPPQLVIPDTITLETGSLPEYPISIHGLKLLIASFSIAHEAMQKDAMEAEQSQ